METEQVEAVQHKALTYDNEATQAKTSYTNLDTFNPDFRKIRLVVQTNTAISMMRLARKNEDVYKKYLVILAHDFILISHKNGYSVFMKRTEYFPEKIRTYSHIKRYEQILYTITPPEKKRSSNSLPNRLLVLFSHMNGGSGYDSNNAIERMFVQYFNDIQRSLVKNVYILRIADLNLSHGSYFVNTPNFPEYETQIQGLINFIREQYNIDSDDVVLYGGSKGGSGALLHAAMGGYKAVAGDPIINATLYNKNKDWHFIKYFRDADLTQRILQYLSTGNNGNKMYIFASQKQKFNFLHSYNLSNLSNGLINLVDLSNDDAITTHPHITAQSVPEQITLINLLFDGEKILGNMLGYRVKKSVIKTQS